MPFSPCRFHRPWLAVTLLLAAMAGLFPGICVWGAPPSPKDPDRLRYPPLNFHPPQAVRFTLANGIGVYVLEDRELPLVNIHAVIRVGSQDDPPGREGLAELTGQGVKSGGAGGLTGDALDETLESMAAILTQSTNREFTSFSLSLLSKDRETGLGLLSRILTSPAFAEEELALSKALKREELRRVADDPQTLAFREFGRLIHEGSPRGRLVTEQSLASVRREDLQGFHQRHYHPGRILLALSGDIDRHEAERLLNRYFGSWSAGGQAAVPPSLPLPRKGGVFLIPKEGPQSIILFGRLAPGKTDPLSLPMELVDFYVGGGGFRSRIVQEIRTDRGLAYSAGSFYQAMGEYGVFGAYAFTKSEATLEVIALLRKILGDTAATPITAEGFNRTRGTFLNSYLFRFTSAEQIALQQLMLEHDGLPRDDLLTYPRRLESLQPSAFNQAAWRFLDPAEAVILVLGNEAACREVERSYPQAQRVAPVF